MARPLRIQYPGATYHVMNRGASRQPIFRDRRDFHNFLSILSDAWGRWKFELYAYCLMGNHYHLCLKTPEAKLSRIMRHINGIYTQRYNRNHGRDGPLFRGRFKAMLIEDEEYLGEVVRYIHLNPVEANIVEKPQDYKWSSHQYYLRHKHYSWLSTERIMGWFQIPKAFHDFVLEGNEKTLEQLYQQKRWPIILGSEDFIERVRSNSPILTTEHVRDERQFMRPSLQRVVEVVAKEWKVPISGLFERNKGKSNLPRNVAIWAMREFGDFSYPEISKIGGFSNERSVGGICQWIQRQSDKNKKFQKRLQRIERLIS